MRLNNHLLQIDANNQLSADQGTFDVASLVWRAATGAACVRAVTLFEAVSHVLSTKGARKVPVGIIGPRDASQHEYELAQTLGRRLTELGFIVICGGRGGAMEGACKGVTDAGGLAIGILPDDNWREANPYVAIPIATGFGEARNALIACASFALVAVGGGYGTLSEIALGLRLGRLVVAFPTAHHVNGAVPCDDVELCLAHIARNYLGLDS